ncbi:hypothetical protein KFK09_008995 [Dendrobium nobile]|uniref:Transmembrane protein n=1 Tax=Dendrobium nobile TaxID=94219 RepID=A0A8T3BSE7_DENNO|nr:hypothetical protein KFK09_008995 [Dendrobium nobile]
MYISCPILVRNCALSFCLVIIVVFVVIRDVKKSFWVRFGSLEKHHRKMSWQKFVGEGNYEISVMGTSELLKSIRGVTANQRPRSRRCIFKLSYVFVFYLFMFVFALVVFPFYPLLKGGHV